MSTYEVIMLIFVAMAFVVSLIKLVIYIVDMFLKRK